MAEPTYKISSYAKFLLKLACELKPVDLEGIKLVLAAEERVRCGRRENIHTAAELFVQLQQIELLGPRNISFFEEVFPAIGRQDLLAVTSDFRELWDTSREIPVPEVIHTANYKLLSDIWINREREETEDVFADNFDNQSQCSSHSRLSSLSDDEKMNLSKRKKKKTKRKRSSSSGSQSSVSKLLAKLKL
ncbi:uncharacterized protein LOC135480724 [Liolophura sinensis]|uniref:uncharacterized protein LOC135480724 n=1 Tax=Liolophura sinensis TaxID=3198878 RepID=UPI0031582683